MRIPLPGLFGSEVERVFLVVVLYEMASLIAEGHELGKAAPVVYVSSEKVFIDVPLQVCEARQAKGYIYLHVQGRSKTEGHIHPNGIGGARRIGNSCPRMAF
ncbi:hypothetical protein CerSpe_170400 [Prunus speciosa]